jgi:hypothetical protein
MQLGRRYWAWTALTQVQMARSSRQMVRLLREAPPTDDTAAFEGALLLVSVPGRAAAAAPAPAAPGLGGPAAARLTPGPPPRHPWATCCSCQPPVAGPRAPLTPTPPPRPSRAGPGALPHAAAQLGARRGARPGRRAHAAHGAAAGAGRPRGAGHPVAPALWQPQRQQRPRQPREEAAALGGGRRGRAAASGVRAGARPTQLRACRGLRPGPARQLGRLLQPAQQPAAHGAAPPLGHPHQPGAAAHDGRAPGGPAGEERGAQLRRRCCSRRCC